MNGEMFAVILGAVGGVTGIVELLKFFLRRRTMKRMDEAEADEKWFEKYEHQLERMNSQIEFKDKRIEDLNEENAAKEQRFIDQTKRLRECQDREYEAQREIRRLTQENCELQLQLKDHRCLRLKCLDRLPKNDHTLQAEAEHAAGTPVEHFRQSSHIKDDNSN